MNEYIKKARLFLEEEQIDYLLVNSTNEFLVEYNDLQKNSRYFLTGFTGSTGDAIVSKDNVYLFVDGRYHIQADLEVNHDDITVIKMDSATLLEELTNVIEENATLGICSKKNSKYRLDNIQKALKEKNITIKLFDKDPIEQTLSVNNQHLTEIPIELSGKSTSDKIEDIRKNLNDQEALLITNLEDLSYIYNLRNFDKENSCSIEGKAIITKNENILFKDETLNNFENYVRNLSDINKIYLNEAYTSAYDYNLIKDKAKKSEIDIPRFIKTDKEIEHYKDCFKRTDKALMSTREYIYENDNISEYDIKTALEDNFKKNGAKCQSFTSIVAIDKNSALAHYSKSSKNEILKDGSLVLIDCGGYYAGGLATDTTRVFVKGKPSELHKKVYTTVLKAFLKAFNIQNFDCGFDIDCTAREFLKKNSPEGFVFNHGLGHGIGISVHESPPTLGAIVANAFKEIKDNMCFTIEPGLYREDFFGVRLENSCYIKDGVINSFTNMCYEEKLIDFSMLTSQEKKWLEKFEVK
ncbi:M24 family metallopeptidase [bacterium]|nr:M24 family metallopeptidase [bacterium]